MDFPFIVQGKEKLFSEADKTYPYAIPSYEPSPEVPWPKSLCKFAAECPVNDTFDNLQDIYSCPHAFQEGCPLFFLHFDEFAETQTVKDVEIWGIGDDSTISWTMDDLKEIVSNFKNRSVDPPMVALGHDENQELLSKAGLPAAGWVDNLRIKGQKLVADLKDVPQKVADAIQNKAYKYISAEIYPSFIKGGENVGKVLRRIALLGADIPKVKSLNEILARYDEHDASLETIWTGVNNMDIEKLQKDLEAAKAEAKKFAEELKAKKIELKAKEDELGSSEDLKTKVTEFSEQLKNKDEEITSLKARAKKLEEIHLAEKAAHHLREIDSFCETLKGSGFSAAIIDEKGLKPFLSALDNSKTLKFAEGDEKTPFAKAVDLFSEIAKAGSNGKLFVPLGSLLEPEDSKCPPDNDPEGFELHQEIRKYAEDHKVSYEDAYVAVTGGK